MLLPDGSPDPDFALADVAGIAEGYGPGEVAAHVHQRAQLMYAVSGTLTVFTAAGSWVLPPHRALWIPGGHHHSFSVRRHAELRALYVDGRAEGSPAWPECVVVSVTPLVRELILAAVAAPWLDVGKGPEARLRRVLLERLAAIPRDPVHLPEPRDARARAFASVARSPANEGTSLSDLLHEAGTSRRTLERSFSQDTGMSVGAWFRQLRLLNAIEHLADGDSVTRAAYRVGYVNPSSFVAAFRRAFGTTPARYFGNGERSPAEPRTYQSSS